SKYLQNSLQEAIAHIENSIGNGAKFGDNSNPLLVSVRSGAPVSMPGMMDTILNLGLNDESVEGLARKSNNRRFALDCYRRFIQMYSNVVLDVDHHNFETILDDIKLEHDITNDAQFTEELLEEIISRFKATVQYKIGKSFTQNVHEQLHGAVEAVFISWMNKRAIYYRKLNNISAKLGTAVTVQAMVFGNLGETSATGVAFTRNPSNGHNALYGEYLPNAQGEDVVAGIRTPYSINIAGKNDDNKEFASLEEIMPEVYAEFVNLYTKLESHYRDMQDIEFTIQEKKLWILQTRNGKRTAQAALKIAVDLVSENKISKEEALKRIDPNSLDKLLHKTLKRDKNTKSVAKGLPASPGAASGIVALSCEYAIDASKKGQRTILVRNETSPEDIEGMNISEGILTARGGMTSHAAVVARGMGKTCITGAKAVKVEKGLIRIGDFEVKEGQKITIDGSTGEIFIGEIPTQDPEISTEFKQVMEWADAIRKVKVRANAETPLDASVARKFGAEGIGLCRTEHMFFNKDRIFHFRTMILERDEEKKNEAIQKLLPYQKHDFLELFKVMDGLPINIRLLDPPLHEFLPQKEDEIAELAQALVLSTDAIHQRIHALHEANPMLGHRGCRLGITFPELYRMQVVAIFEAAKEAKTQNIKPVIEIMLPLIIHEGEIVELYKIINDVATKYPDVEYEVGTMIEVPRAAICADKIAQHANYFSFGTNDLTQTTLGISRDDSSSFISKYEEKGILPIDPFVSIDVDGVGSMVKMAMEKGRSVKPKLKCGVCGEHGGDPASIKFFASIGIDYVSCSPYRVPIARLASAIAELKS
ncbi:MAG: pyruvate, phosphate dikinase, partial [Proteobacteria bacterium]|nr:pyruvate, phosphate dikinase [Pseudomonadota bacterium]